MVATTTQFLVPVYVAYFGFALAITAWLARTLFRNGALFLDGVFGENHAMAEAVNRLLVTGFFMINLGYAAFLMKAGDAASTTEAIEVLARKLGVLLLSLAVVHFVNLLVLSSVRRRNELLDLAPPVAPQHRVPTATGA